MKRILFFLGLVLCASPLLAGTTDFIQPGLSGTISSSPTFTGTVSLDADGVVLDSDNDGMLVMTGLGNGSDEDMRINLDDTADTIVVTSTTGVTDFQLSGMKLTAPSVQLDTVTTGVSLDTDGDGMLIIAGTGNGNDEDLRLNLDDVADTVTVTSSTGVTTMNFSSIALQESGIGVLNNDEIDASSELAAIMDDETGSGALCFATSPVFTTGISLGADDLKADITIHDAGTIVMYDDSDDTTVTIGPVADGTTILGITGTLNPTAITEGGIAVLNNDEMDASSELATIIDDETGTGVIVFGTSPTLTTADITVKTTAGITASVTQTQGQGPLTANINEVSTVANANDTVTLPAAAVGYVVTVINNGANVLQVFPASGDNLGAGVDTATTMAAGENRVWTAYDTTNWENTGGSL